MHVPGKWDAAGLFPRALRGGIPQASPILFLLVCEPFCPAYCNVSDPIGMGFKLDCLKKPFFGGRVEHPGSSVATHEADSPSPVSPKSQALAVQRTCCLGRLGWMVAGRCGTLHPFRAQWQLDATVSAQDPECRQNHRWGRQGTCVWCRPMHGAGRDAPGKLLPAAPVPPCPCRSWFPHGQATPPPIHGGIPQPPKRQNSRVISQGD